MDLWDLVRNHLAEIISIAIILFGFLKLLSHSSPHTPKTRERQQRWKKAHEDAEREGQLAVDDIHARHGGFFEGLPS